MAITTLVLGVPGSGKSTSIRTLDHKNTYVITPNTKSLPFKGARTKYKTGAGGNLVRSDDFNLLSSYIKAVATKRPEITTIIIDDFTHYFNATVMSDAFMGSKGYDKWSSLAQNAFKTMVKAIEGLRDDLFIVFMAHTKDSTDADGNREVTMRTCGRLLDNSIQLPSYFTYVLHTQVFKKEVIDDNGNTSVGMNYQFLTNYDGVFEAKTPEGMFPKYIDNDLQLVRNEIFNWEFSEE